MLGIFPFSLLLYSDVLFLWFTTSVTIPVFVNCFCYCLYFLLIQKCVYVSKSSFIPNKTATWQTRELGMYIFSSLNWVRPFRYKIKSQLVWAGTFHYLCWKYCFWYETGTNNTIFFCFFFNKYLICIDWKCLCFRLICVLDWFVTCFVLF